MKANAGRFRIVWVTKALDVSSSGYYSWLKRPESPRRKENKRLAVEIKAVHEAFRRIYGSRIQAELAAKGISCSPGRGGQADEGTGYQGQK